MPIPYASAREPVSRFPISPAAPSPARSPAPLTPSTPPRAPCSPKCKSRTTATPLCPACTRSRSLRPPKRSAAGRSRRHPSGTRHGPQVALVAPDGSVHYQIGRLGRDFGDKLEVLSGLNEGDQLVVNPSDAIREGAKVKPVLPRKRAAFVKGGLLLTHSSQSRLAPPASSPSCAPGWRPPLWQGLPACAGRRACPLMTLPSSRSQLYPVRTYPAPVTLDNSPRIHDLIRAGSIYLSLQDALSLAIENNLDVELQRFTIPQGDSEFLRAKGGGTTRGLNYTLSEVPTGVGGPLSPLVTNPAATGSATNGTSVPSNALELGTLGEPQDQLLDAGHNPAIQWHSHPRLRPRPRWPANLEPSDHARNQSPRLRPTRAGHSRLHRRRRHSTRIRHRRPAT